MVTDVETARRIVATAKTERRLRRDTWKKVPEQAAYARPAAVESNPRGNVVALGLVVRGERFQAEIK